MINRIGLVIMLSIAIFFVGCQGTEVSNSKQQVSLNFEAQYIRTDGYNEGVDYPVVSLISSAQELEEYYTRNKESYNLERQSTFNSDSTIGFLDATDRYDDEFFKDNILVMVLIEESSGSNRHEVTEIKSSEKQVEIGIKRKMPEIGTTDMAQWHIIIELERATFNKNAEIIVTME